MLMIFSCDKSDPAENSSIYGKWEADDFMSVESAAYSKKDAFNPIIELKEDGSYLLKLDRNSCMGSFILKNSNNISFSASGCTEICCDSEFSNKFVLMLTQVKSYSIEKNILKLEIPGWGWIELNSTDKK
jgi:heat shock protein HslJ